MTPTLWPQHVLPGGRGAILMPRCCRECASGGGGATWLFYLFTRTCKPSAEKYFRGAAECRGCYSTCCLPRP